MDFVFLLMQLYFQSHREYTYICALFHTYYVVTFTVLFMSSCGLKVLPKAKACHLKYTDSLATTPRKQQPPGLAALPIPPHTCQGPLKDPWVLKSPLGNAGLLQILSSIGMCTDQHFSGFLFFPSLTSESGMLADSSALTGFCLPITRCTGG